MTIYVNYVVLSIQYTADSDVEGGVNHSNPYLQKVKLESFTKTLIGHSYLLKPMGP